MSRLLFSAFLLCLITLVPGCGGCSGHSARSIKRYALIAPPEESEDAGPPAATPPADTAQPAAVSPPAAEQTPTPSGSPAGATTNTPPKANTPVPPAAPPAIPRVNPEAYVQKAPQTIITPAKPAATLSPSQARTATVDNLKKISSALQAYSLRNAGKLPPAAIHDPQGLPLLSWRVALLPELGFEALYKQFRITEPWDSPYNLQLVKQIPPVFQSPERFDENTNYLAATNEQSAFFGPEGKDLKSFYDGAENTILIVESNDSLATPWTKPSEYSPQYQGRQTGLEGLRPDGFLAVLGNGDVKLVPTATEAPIALRLFLISDRDQVVAAEFVKDAGGDAPAPVVAVTTSPATATPDIPLQAAKLDPILPTPDSRPPVPHDEDLLTARETMRQIYKAEYVAARKPADRAKLAQKMLTDAKQVEANLPDYHELLRIARDLAVAGGDATAALEAVELLSSRFFVDRLELRLKTLEDLSKTTKIGGNQDKLLTEASKFMHEAFEADNYDVATRACDLSLVIARAKGDKAAIARLTHQRQTLDVGKTAYTRVPAAEGVLRVNPSDPQANEIVGNYRCLTKGRWSQALPLLAKGADVRLKVLAQIDLDPAKSPKQMLDLADQYWQLADEQKQPQKCGLQIRAAYWYRQAGAQLTGSLEKVRALKRYDEIVAQYGAEVVARAANDPTPPTGSPASS